MGVQAGLRSEAASRGRLWFALLITMLVLIPVAVAYACNPQAHISLDRSSYSPGSSMTVYGSYFPSNAKVTLSGPGGSPTVTTSQGGAFTYSGFTAPSEPGSYTITASRPTGGFASTSFRVSAPAPASQSPASTQPAPSQAPASPAPAESQPRPAVRTPSVARSERVREPARRQEAARRPAPLTTVQTTPAGQPVFAGSPAPVAAGTFAAAPAPRAATGARQRAGAGRGDSRARSVAPAPSQQTAFSDVWRSFEPGRTPSLAATAGASSGGTGSQLAWGLALLGLGLFALVGGLAYGEARRRRTA